MNKLEYIMVISFFALERFDLRVVLKVVFHYPHGQIQVVLVRAISMDRLLFACLLLCIATSTYCLYCLESHIS